MKQNLDNIRITFLVSRGRSGSTLLQSILDAHPNICAPIESKFVLHLYTKYNKITNWDNKITNSFIADIYTNRKFRLFWNVQQKELEILFSRYEINSFSDACKVVYLSHQSMFPKEEIKLVVDKNPLYSAFIPVLLKIFPNANFIHLIRDPRASTYSHVKALIQKNIPQTAYDWRLLNEKTEETKIELPHLFHTIKYEELTSQPSEKLKSLFEFINISFIPELLNANKIIKEKIETSKYLSLNHHTNISEPIYTTTVSEWKSKLTRKEIETINAICEQQLIKYKYPYKKPNNTFNNQLIFNYGKWRSIFTHWLLRSMFKSPFIFRVMLYRIISLLRDYKYKD